ncbi:MAG: 23S rRNA (uracil(1939)-C(5))-methyltransferase RlmD [Vicinamibacterales bacterium]
MADVDLDIEALSPAGDGLGVDGGRTWLVPFTIPGERVRVRPAPHGRTARLLAVLRPSPHRVTPKCRHFGPAAVPGVGPCGGCAWQHIAYAEQLRLKTGIVDRLVREAVRGAPAARPTLPATPIDDPWGYRQKVHFVFGTGGDGALVMGHYVRGSRRIVPVDECPVHDERGNALAFQLQAALERRRVAAADNRRGGTLRAVAVRVALRSDEMLATIVAAHTGDARLRAATRATMADRQDVAFHLNVQPTASPYIFGRDTRRLQGTERLREAIDGTSFLIAPTAFFQTNVAAAERLVALVLESIPRGARVLDLYAGAGLFALPLARQGCTVTAVEENRDAVAAGIAAARLNGIDAQACRFVARRAEDAIATGTVADAVVLDPPRDGCTTTVIDAVFGGLRPRVAAYVSCNPEALATDLARIVARGYRIRSLQPVDMFPHTAHIETVAVVSR